MGGFFGVVAKQNCTSDVFFGTDYHSHLGTVRGGLAYLAEGRFHRAIHDISNTQFRSKFDGDYRHFSKLEPVAGIGIISDDFDQPLLIASHLGIYTIAIVGVVTNLEELVAELYRREGGTHLSELGGGCINATEVIASLINSQATFVDGLRYVQQRVEGSSSVLILTNKGEIYAARDRHGRTPVSLARKENALAVAMESCSFPNLGYTLEYHLGAGEILRVTADGYETLSPATPADCTTCAFMWVYFGFPASNIDGANVETVRYRSGQLLAHTAPVDADLVAGIPDSGVAHALGYAAESKIRYARPFIKYTPTWPRSFTPSNDDMRQRIARMKLIPIPELINGKRIIFCDDSIVRGTQLRGQVARLMAAGAREIHMRIACPPLLYRCKFINFSRFTGKMDLMTRRVIRELDGPDADIAAYQDPDGTPYKRMVETIRKELGLTTLAFQRVEDVPRAIDLPDDPVCTYCWTCKKS